MTVSYKYTVTSLHETFVVVDSTGNHIELLAHSKVQVTSNRFKYVCIIDVNHFDMIVKMTIIKK